MSLIRNGPLELVTFDGDVTLYDDGKDLTEDNPIIPKILQLMRRGSKIGIVTAAGYAEAKPYYGRLYGLLDAIQASDLPLEARQNLIIMGGESNFCFKFDENSPVLLRLIPREEWLLKEMLSWHESDIKDLLDLAEVSLRDTVKNFRMEASVVRKERAVGIVPKDGHKFCRETLEETVLIVQKILVGLANMGKACTADEARKYPRSASVSPFARSTAETTFSSTLETSLGVCWPVSGSLEESRAARRCT
jgi:IMP and pyridine-specific 5'-nucleotidase